MSAYRPNRRPARRNSTGFTLVELLVVLAIMAILLTIAISGLQSVLGSSNINASASQISDTFTQARAYAQANNTYVIVALTEVDGTTASVNLNAPLVGGTGRVIIEVVATQDGTNALSNTAGASNLVSISKPLVINNLHLVDLSGINPAAGNMNRTAVIAGSPADLTGAGYAQLPSPANPPWPYAGTFTGIFLQIDPRGDVVPIQGAFPAAAPYTIPVGNLAPLLELGLQTAHGNTVIVPGAGNDKSYAALQIQGITGAVTTYRP